jgi:broad specificity phosphatase PhoE
MAKRTMIWKTAAVLAVAMFVGACGGGGPQARSITLTFIRNAQSQANADGVIDTTVPGPSLTADGKGQAQQLAHQVARNEFDSIYTSTMAEAQQTAGPLASEVGKQVEIVSGLQSIDAGWYNGKPETMAASTYLLAPADWISGDVGNSIPGSLSGRDFNSEFTTAVRKIYDSGHNKPVVFSQGTAIMVWTLMNAKNPGLLTCSPRTPDIACKTGLLTTHPLPNIGRVVLTGNPMTGWTLTDWDGVRSFS